MRVEASKLKSMLKIIDGLNLDLPIIFNDDGLAILGFNGSTFYFCMQLNKSEFEDYPTKVHRFVINSDIFAKNLLTCNETLDITFNDNESEVYIKEYKKDKLVKKINLRTIEYSDFNFINEIPKSVKFNVTKSELKEIFTDFSTSDKISFLAKENILISAQNKSYEIEKVFEGVGEGEKTMVSLEILKKIKSLDYDMVFEFEDNMPLQISVTEPDRKYYFVVANRGE